MRVGVFALQGDVREHLQLLTSLGVESIEVRNAEQLATVDGLIIPGGESTTISKLIDIFELRDDLLKYISSGNPVYGTCAGMIMLASEVLDAASGQQSLKAMDISVRRNAFGSQLDSFEASVEFAGRSVDAAFIRSNSCRRTRQFASHLVPSRTYWG